jgi:DNA-directed RNA polymerase subunit beta
VLVEDAIDAQKGVVLARAFEPLTKQIVRTFEKHDITTIRVIDTAVDEGAIIRALKKDPTRNEEEALKEIYKRLRPGEPPTTANAKALLKRLFFDPKRYDLGRVGRYKINQKLGLKAEPRAAHPRERRHRRRHEVPRPPQAGDGVVDDIDHLGSRRVRTVGELLANQCRVGLARTERLVRERMTMYDQSVDSITPQKLINPKALTTVIRDFFARSQLSQFMDQINPLAEVTHKRRLSALGPGGLNRERAGFEVRDVHPSHYGRICPIETPEGPNIGLINSLSTYARVNEFGFIETPYRVVQGRPRHRQDRIPHRRPGGGQGHRPGQLRDRRQGPLHRQGHRPQGRQLPRGRPPRGRLHGRLAQAGHLDRRRHDSVPRARRRQPRAHGLEHAAPGRAAAPERGAVRRHRHRGARRPRLQDRRRRRGGRHRRLRRRQAHRHHQGRRDAAHRSPKTTRRTTSTSTSCASSCARTPAPASTRSRSSSGPEGQGRRVIADGPSTDHGEMALGRNVLVAFMPWNGYNFEDAILISEKVLKEDIFTSIHIQEFEVTARDTKLGPEEITRDIPNVGEEALKNLDHNGVIRIGAEVKPGDILVGKITPKSETELAPEEKLLRAIFGEKAADVKDTSLVVPSGVTGIIMDVKVSSRIDEQEKLSPSDRRRQVKQIQEDYKTQMDKLREGSPRRSPTSSSARRSRSTSSTARPARSSSRPTARSPRRSCASSPPSPSTSRSIRRR